MYGQMNEPPGARARVALTGLTIAEVTNALLIFFVIFVNPRWPFWRHVSKGRPDVAYACEIPEFLEVT